MEKCYGFKILRRKMEVHVEVLESPINKWVIWKNFEDELNGIKGEHIIMYDYGKLNG